MTLDGVFDPCSMWFFILFRMKALSFHFGYVILNHPVCNITTEKVYVLICATLIYWNLFFVLLYSAGRRKLWTWCAVSWVFLAASCTTGFLETTILVSSCTRIPSAAATNLRSSIVPIGSLGNSAVAYAVSAFHC